MRPRDSAVSFVRHGICGQTLVPLFYILKNKTVSFRVVGVFRALKSIICGKQNPCSTKRDATL